MSSKSNKRKIAALAMAAVFGVSMLSACAPQDDNIDNGGGITILPIRKTTTR